MRNFLLATFASLSLATISLAAEDSWNTVELAGVRLSFLGDEPEFFEEDDEQGYSVTCGDWTYRVADITRCELQGGIIVAEAFNNASEAIDFIARETEEGDIISTVEVIPSDEAIFNFILHFKEVAFDTYSYPVTVVDPVTGNIHYDRYIEKMPYYASNFIFSLKNGQVFYVAFEMDNYERLDGVDLENWQPTEEEQSVINKVVNSFCLI